MQMNVQLSQLAAFLPPNGEFTKVEAILDLIKLAEHPMGDELPSFDKCTCPTLGMELHWKQASWRHWLIQGRCK